MFMVEIWVRYIMVSLKKVDAPFLTIANFGHPVSKSWLRPCMMDCGTSQMKHKFEIFEHN